MKALVSPNEPVTDYLGNVGSRIAQVEPDDNIFPVGEPLFWTDCPDDCVMDVWWWYENKCQIFPVEPEEPVSTPDQ
jgi:hypothetical protein